MGLADRQGSPERPATGTAGGQDPPTGAVAQRDARPGERRYQFDFAAIPPQVVLTALVALLATPSLFLVYPVSVVMVPVFVWIGLADWRRWPRTLVRQIDGEWLLVEQGGAVVCLTAISGHHLPGGLLLLRCEHEKQTSSQLIARWQLPLNDYVVLCGLLRFAKAGAVPG